MIPPEEYWATVAETAEALKRSPKTVRNLVSLHQLPRRIIPIGSAKRRVMILSYATRRRLERLCWGTSTLKSPAKKPPVDSPPS